MTPPLRSRNWFGPKTLDGLMNRGYLKAEGFSDPVFDGRPVIGIANSWSELNNCNAHLRQVAIDHVLQADEGVDFDFLRGARPVVDADTAGSTRL